MKPIAPLRGEERDFFGRLADLVFSNPFAGTETSLAGLPEAGRGPGSGEHPLAAAALVADRQIERLESRGIADLGSVGPEDRRLLESAYLLQAYDRFIEPFDALIRTQLAAGDEPVAVSFAGDLARLLKRRGFAAVEIGRLVALFYQLRRAYFFIAHSLLGDSPSMEQLRSALWDSVFTSDILAYRDHLWDRMEDFSTLLLGETGTGKGTAAAAIGRSGLIPFDEKKGRFACSFTSTFIATNLSQFPETLIESELFGHRKGSFTGAIEDHEGLFGRCSPHGSLFLDEIGDLSAPVQLKLLNVIQDRIFSPVGSRRTLRFEGRVIAATNRPLDELRRQGRIRDDFFFRLSSDVIEVPPLRQRLRERPSELAQLAGQLLARMTGKPDERLAARVLERLRRHLPAGYAWPGNVRELEQALRRILVKGRYVADPAGRAGRPAWLDEAAEGRLTADELLGHYCRQLYDRHGSYEEVARRTALDRRTVKKHVTSSAPPHAADRGGL